MARSSSLDARSPSGDSHAARIEVYADLSCPFTHVGLRRLTAARDARAPEIRIRVRAWPLEWINGHPLAPDLVAAEVVGLRASVAPDLFAGFDAANFPRTTIPALGLAAAAYRLGDAAGERMSLRLREALFEEGRDLADEEQLRAIGCELGVEALDPRAGEAAVRADWERGRARNVRGSPHFFVRERDWFCPSLRVRHEGARFDISLDGPALDEFYAAALA